MATLTNAEIGELLARAAESEEAGSNRERAMRRAARAAFFWPVEAASLPAADRSLTELPSVGPWLARTIAGWLLDPSIEPPQPPSIRSGFLTMAEARVTLHEHPEWMADLRADLQMHTTYSDGTATLPVMAEAARDRGYQFVAVTDHSKGLKIAGGMDEEELAEQGAHIALVNRDLEAEGSPLRVLRSIEMNLSPEGEQDMDPDALSRLELVLGAFHSKLRTTEDQTERYLKAPANQTFHVPAHPKARTCKRLVGSNPTPPAQTCRRGLCGGASPHTDDGPQLTSRARHAWSASVALLKRHWIFSILFAIGAFLRIIVSVAYRPALFFYGDSYSYLTNARHLRPDPIHPILYPLFLRPFLAIHHLLPVPIVQHIMGLACGLLVYILLRRLGLGPGWAVAGAAPVLLDAYQLNVEQYLLAEALFEVLILGAFVAMLWWKRPSVAACGAAGGLLGLA